MFWEGLVKIGEWRKDIPWVLMTARAKSYPQNPTDGNGLANETLRGFHPVPSGAEYDDWGN